MTLDELNQDLERLKGGIVQTIFDTTDIAAASFVALFLRRVQFKGENSGGNKLGLYAASTSLYKKRRGQQSQFVNLTDTFQMLGSVDLQNKKLVGNNTLAVISPNESSRGNITNKGIMEVQEGRYGVIMAPQPDELEAMLEVYDDSLQRLLDNF